MWLRPSRDVAELYAVEWMLLEGRIGPHLRISVT